MQYVGIQTQQSRNNFRSLLLLCLFPCLVMGLLFAFCYLLHLLAMNDDGLTGAELLGYSTGMFIHLAPYVLGGVLIWFIIAYFANTSIINSATGSEPLSRMENKRVYNLVENLCMSQGMKMPKINIINDDSLNAFASGINERTYTVSLSRGIIDKLNDQELEAVIAHELSHIRNKDVRRDDQESARPRQRTTENLGRSRHRSRQTRRRSPAFHPASGPTGQKRTERFKRTFRHSSTH